MSSDNKTLKEFLDQCCEIFGKTLEDIGKNIKAPYFELDLEKKITLDVFSTDFGILIDLVAEKIQTIFNQSFENNPNIHFDKDFLLLVNLFNYLYCDIDYVKSKKSIEFRDKLISIYKGTLFSYMFI